MKKGTAPVVAAAAALPPPSAPAPDTEEEDTAVSNDGRDSTWAGSEAATPRRKIPANPSAGEVHRREQGAPWRAAGDEQIRIANEKAKAEQAEKRRWGLAKQVQDGLMHNYSINYGVAELAALLKEGLSLRAQGKAELSSTEVAYVQLLVAAEKYELKQLPALLDKFPKGRADSKKKDHK